MLRSTLLLFAVSSALGAQSAQTTKLAPPPRDDSIYKLAGSAADYPQEPFIYLLDDGVVSRNADGTGKETYRQVIRILKPEAVERFQEQEFSYSPGHQRMTINWLRVIKPNGQVIEQPSQIQDSDIPAELGDPVYSDTKVRRASLTGLEPGAMLDYSVTTEELKPFLSGDYLESWSVTTGVPTMRSRYVVDLPADVTPRIRERNLTFKRTEQVANGRRIFTWATSNVPKIKSEPFAADSNGVTMSVSVGAPIEWSKIAAWYADNARDRYTPTPKVVAKVDELVKGSRTLDDSIRAIHKWVAQDIRYVSIALGLGGYQPRLPDSVIATGFGDCKDKATLFITALKHIGVTAFPVLLNSGGGIRHALPSINQFDHVIVAVARPGGYRYVDVTADLIPYGELPGDEQGEFGLVVHPDGTSEEITFPVEASSSNRDETHLVGTLSSDGLFNGHYEEKGVGGMAVSLRSLFENPLDSAMRADLPTKIARDYFSGAVGDSLVAFNGKDLSAPAVVSLRISSGRATQSAGTTEIFTLPFGAMTTMAEAATEFAKQPPRKFPIDASKVFGPREAISELRLTLPAGWTAKLPANVSATSEFGTYKSEYSMSGRELRMLRTISGTRGIYPPDKIGDLIAWFAAVGKDDSKFIVMEKGAGTK